MLKLQIKEWNLLGRRPNSLGKVEMDRSPCLWCGYLRTKPIFLPAEGDGRESEVVYCGMVQVSSQDFTLRYFGTTVGGELQFPDCLFFQEGNGAP